jgi:alkyl hydroperoxide reductase subunit AhpC
MLRKPQGHALNFPVIADADRKVSNLFGMMHPEVDPSITDRSIFRIDPNKKVRTDPVLSIQHRAEFQ